MNQEEIPVNDREAHTSLDETTCRVGTLYRQAVVDNYSRNHGFLWAGAQRVPADHLNPTPTDLKFRILSTNNSLDEGACCHASNQ